MPEARLAAAGSSASLWQQAWYCRSRSSRVLSTDSSCTHSRANTRHATTLMQRGADGCKPGGCGCAGAAGFVAGAEGLEALRLGHPCLPSDAAQNPCCSGAFSSQAADTWQSAAACRRSYDSSGTAVGCRLLPVTAPGARTCTSAWYSRCCRASRCATTPSSRLFCFCLCWHNKAAQHSTAHICDATGGWRRVCLFTSCTLMP